MTVWIVNPFDNLPLEGYRPQRYWLMAQAFAAAGHNVVYWTSDFSHANKAPRRVDDLVKESSGCCSVRAAAVTVKLVPTPPYAKNVSLARVRSHRRLAANWLACARREARRPDIVIRNYFTAIVQNEYVVKAEISRTLISIVIKLILLMANANLTWFITAYMFDFVLLGTGYIMAYRTKIGSLREWHFDRDYARFLLKESFPLLLTNAAVIIYQRIDQVMIGSMIDKSSVGFFSVAAKFTEVLTFLPMILAQTITPILVKARERDIAEYNAKAQQFMNFSFWLSLLAATFVSIIAYWLIRYTFGTAYLPAVAVLQVMAFKAASVALSNTAGAMLVTEGLQRWAILRDGFGCIVCVLLNYLLLPRYGIMAAAFVSIASNIAAGYLVDALVPAYRHLFVCQTETLLLGWMDIKNIKSFFTKKSCC